MSENYLKNTCKEKTLTEIENNEAFITSISKNIKDGLVYQLIINGYDRKFTYLSESIKTIHGLNADEAKSDYRLLYNRIHPDDIKKLVEKENNSIKEMSVFKAEFRTLSPEGKYFWVENVSYPRILNDGSICFDGIQFNIDERKKLEKEILSNEIKLKKIFEISNIGISITDEEGNIIDCNKASEKLLGISKEEHLKRNYAGKEWKIFGENNKIMPIEEYASVKALKLNKPIHNTIMKLIKNNSDFVWLNVSAIPMNLPGYGVLITYTDISERKIIEENLEKLKNEAENANSSKSIFLANMSHELRTPLNAILGFSEILMEDEKNEEKLEMLKLINSSGNVLLRLINDLLDLTKIEASKMEIYKENFSINEVINELESIYRVLSLNKNNKLLISKNIYSDIVNADLFKIKQILTNILGNSIKFTENGKIDFEIFEENINEKMSYYNFIITDNGIGINANKMKKLFEPFEQGDSSLTRKYGGSGLGLSIVKKLLDIMNGEINIESQENKGTTIHIRIPLEKISDIDNIIIKNTQTIKDYSQYKILLVEDEETNIKLISTIFKQLNLNFEIAENGSIGIDKFKSNIYDLIFTDIQMPVMNGFEFAEEIRKINNTIPIIATSAFAMESEINNALSKGFNSYITKPFSKQKIIEACEKFFVKK